ncbi:TonB-dependent receptor [Mariniflexile litorale]|uniref:TonB-dependent receptor n=1 Tax=Mariniflexile litorale TaxID=3045158 RepID=A0AAU7ELI0_9FLAO|nr:TonB-dependent receptor [Mariniflexile sp. KMM 9835]MDQ8211197.1 TonB-dependent receptor [Mariniflexile sp. KMM 9835]
MYRTKCLIVSFVFIFLGKATSQNSITSKVFDFEKNTPVLDVSIRIQGTDKGTYTNEDGFFYLDNIANSSILILSKIGYSPLHITVNDIGDVIYLEPEISLLKEVTIRTFSSSQLKKVVPGQIYFSQKDIERLPFILGEKDVIKLIQYTPGVQQATEGQSGLLVRGGNGSMNLTLLDNIYLHNTSHLGGLFSAINSDFVHSLEFSKAGFDASYGGRLSSITDIKTLKAPDSTYFNGSLGLLSTKLTGNIKIDNSNSLLISGRRTYLELFKPIFGKDDSVLGKDSNYSLHDFFVKHSLSLTSRDKLETSLYLTEDNYKDKTKGRNRKLKWGNFLLGTTYTHQFSNSFSSQTTLSNSFYKFSFGSDDFIFDYDANSTYNVLNLNHHFLWDKTNYLFKIGASYNKNKILPKRVQASINNSPLEILNQETYKFDDVSLFGDLEFQIYDKLKVKSGLRFTTYITESNALVTNDKFYCLEPRLSVKYQFKDNQAFKFSYQKLNQFIHQASFSSFSLPADFFVISNKDVKPQVSNQLSLSYIFEENGTQFNSALFFKNVSNYTEFSNGSINNLFSNNIYEDIVAGKFNSYGLELSINKKINKLTAQAALTLSKTIAQFDAINQGNYFSTNFDRPINFNTIVSYKLNDRIELGTIFLFTSGQNYTRPKDIRIVGERPIVNFESKNASRFPNYHRLDLSCTYSFKQKGKWNSKLNLTLYNAYNNNNPFQIYFATDGNADDSFIEIIEKRDNFFPLLPTLNWLFSF